MTRKLILLVAFVLALGVLSGGIAIAAGGGAGPQAESPAGDETGEDEDGAQSENGSGSQDDDGAKAENGGSSESETGDGEASDSEETVSDPAAKKAADAAVAATGGGTVTSVERDDGDGDAGYEVELRKTDGSEVEVHVDKGFNVRQSGGDD